jgi:hypothetical protein
MNIDSYSFGHIVIDGKAYTSDVIIYRDHVDASWWRKEGHNLDPADVSEVVKAHPDVFIIGSGYNGVMTVKENTRKQIAATGIKVIVEKTSKAVELYNSYKGKKEHVAAALHITC